MTASEDLKLYSSSSTIQQPRQEQSERVPELDALRGLAALAVVVFHLLPQYFYVGWMGVDVFFALSGFLITRIILGGHSERSFSEIFIYEGSCVSGRRITYR